MRRRVQAGIALAVVAVALGGWLHGRRERLPQGFAFDWPAGTRDTYALRWHSHDATVVAGMARPLTGELELEGELAMTSLGRHGEVYWLEARLQELAAHRVIVLDEAVVPDAEQARANLVGPTAYLEIEPTGRVRSIRFPAHAPDLYKHVMQGLFSELQVVMSPEPAWTDELATVHGRARVGYTRDDDRTLTRRRTGYASLLAISEPEQAHAQIAEHGTGHITLDPLGVIGAFDEDEQLAVQVDGKPRITADLALHLVHLRRDRPSGALATLPDGLEARHPGVPAVSDATEQRLLDQRVAGLSLEEMKTDLWDHANDGAMPDDHAWFSRASGFVIAHPGSAAELAALFSDAHFNAVGRRLILDVLTAAGHPQAQAALRTALASPEARGDRSYPMMLQRISLLPQPTRETVAFVEATMRGADAKREHAIHMASAFSLGSAAGHLAAHGETSLARHYNDELRAELAAATDERSRGELLRALGNVGLDDNRALVLGHRDDPSPTVRTAVASALHKDGSASAQQALIGLAEDASGLVQQAALGALEHHPLAAAELGALATAAAGSKITTANQPLVVDLLAARLDQPVAVAALQHLLDHTEDGQLKARISSMLMNRGLL